MIDLSNVVNDNLESKKCTAENNIEDNIEDNIENENYNETMNENQEVSNCLALTIKKDYNISVVKNVFIRTARGIWKVAISMFTLNIFKFFF